MKKSIVAVGILLSVLNSNVYSQTGKKVSVEKKWELAGFKNPESILSQPKTDILFISNVNGNPGDKDGNGYISKVSRDGKMITEKWVADLNAPKGMVISKNKLYVTDIDEIVEINLSTGKILKKYKAEGATFLNDITASKDGIIYASNTFGFSAIYQLKNGKTTLWMKSDDLQMPNGLYTEGNQLLVASWGIGFNPENYTTKTPGSLLTISTKDKSIKTLSSQIGNLDGLEKTIHGYLLTDWLSGKLIYFAGNKATELLDLPQGSADLGFNTETKEIFIPLMNDNKVVAYQLMKK